MIFGWVMGAIAFASVDLTELKKHDYSIVLPPPAKRNDLSKRCFLRPDVVEALGRVQQRLRLLHSGLRVSKCYDPKDPKFSRGAALSAELAELGQGNQKEFQRLMAAERFTREGKGVFLHETWKDRPSENIPISDLP